VCSLCGIVQEANIIDQTNEKRQFSSEIFGTDNAQNRVNAGRINPYLSGLGLDTIIDGKSKGVKELNRHNYPKVLAQDKNMQKGMKKISDVSYALNLNQREF